MHRTEINVETNELVEIELTQAEIDYLFASANIEVAQIIVSPRQIRQALNFMNLRVSVETAIAAGSQDLKDWWEYANVIEEKHPQVIEMAALLNVTESTVHDLFALASTL